MRPTTFSGDMRFRASSTSLRGVLLAEPEALPDRRTAEIGVDQEHLGIGRLSESACDVDRRRRLTFPDAGAADGDDREPRGSMGLLDQVPESTVLLRFKRSWSQKAD